MQLAVGKASYIPQTEQHEPEAEEVRHGDVTAGVKCAWNVITADKYSFFHS